jgi:hypothetical protein
MADEKGEVLNIVERRIEDLERRVLSNDEDLKKFQNESVSKVQFSLPKK